MLNLHFYFADNALPGFDIIVADKPHGLPRSEGEHKSLSSPVVAGEGKSEARVVPPRLVESDIVRRSRVVFDPSNRPRKRSRRA